MFIYLFTILHDLFQFHMYYYTIFSFGQHKNFLQQPKNTFPIGPADLYSIESTPSPGWPRCLDLKRRWAIHPKHFIIISNATDATSNDSTTVRMSEKISNCFSLFYYKKRKSCLKVLSFMNNHNVVFCQQMLASQPV